MKSLLGKKIGEGSWRYVYEHKGDPAFVIKVGKSRYLAGKFWNKKNKIEYNNWISSSQYGLSDWLAPCDGISKCGLYLVQRRGTPVSKLPKNIPNILKKTQQDYKHIGNWVEIDGRVVMCDYSAHGLFRGQD